MTLEDEKRSSECLQSLGELSEHFLLFSLFLAYFNALIHSVLECVYPFLGIPLSF